MAGSSPSQAADAGHTLATLPKTWRFTQALPGDPQFPTPAASHQTPRDHIRPRLVKGALFTWVRPEGSDDPELLATSPAALRDLGLRASEAATDDFRQTAAGNRLWGWEDSQQEAPGGEQADAAKAQQPYPWAQCYGGFQFGNWAGQLGDGRAISLFEVPVGSRSYEVQLKGAGSTPYSRMADGLAVLRSSIREFVASEALHGLDIPTTRALALTLLRDVLVHRERLEPGAIVVRFAETWLRLGTFDLLRARGDRALTLQLATYAAESVFGGWDRLPARLDDSDNDNDNDPPSYAAVLSLLQPARNVAAGVVQGPAASAENRFARLYREVVRRNAETVAHWQAYGFMNGVLNTDNTSVYGLSMDFGPFAFLDNFDPSYTPNHDDGHLRYSYQNQPSIVWWNLVRFGEALGALIAAGPRVDDPVFLKDGIMGLAKANIAASGGSLDPPEADLDKAAERLASVGEAVILRAGEEYKNLFLATYKRLFAARLGLPPPSTADLDKASEIDPLVTSLLSTMQTLELDFNLFFRRLSSVRLADIATDDQRRSKASIFFYRDRVSNGVSEDDSWQQVADWLATWRERILAAQDGKDADQAEADRIRAMKAVNPNFIPRGWVLDEVIRRVEKEGERDVLRRIIHMALHPFEDSWHGKSFDGDAYIGDPEEEVRWTQDVPRKDRAMQCSCSS